MHPHRKSKFYNRFELFTIFFFGVRVDFFDNFGVFFVDDAAFNFKRRRQFAAFDGEFFFEQREFLDFFVIREIFRSAL